MTRMPNSSVHTSHISALLPQPSGLTYCFQILFTSSWWIVRAFIFRYLGDLLMLGGTRKWQNVHIFQAHMWSTWEGNGKPLQYSCLENPMNNMKRQNDRILKEEPPRSVDAQNATGDQWRNNSRKNERMEPKQKQYPAVDVTGDRSKVRCCKEQYCIGTWNIRSMN